MVPLHNTRNPNKDDSKCLFDFDLFLIIWYGCENACAGTQMALASIWTAFTSSGELSDLDTRNQTPVLCRSSLSFLQLGHLLKMTFFFDMSSNQYLCNKQQHTRVWKMVHLYY